MFNFLLLLNVKALIITVVGFALIGLFRNFRAVNRQIVLRQLLTVLLVLPLLALVVSFVPSTNINIKTPQAFMDVASEDAPKLFWQTEQGESDVGPVSQTLSKPPIQPQTLAAPVNFSGISWRLIAFNSYIAVTVLLMAGLFTGLWLAERRLSRFEVCKNPVFDIHLQNLRKQIGLRKKCNVLINPDEETPFVWGWLRPTLVLPRSFFQYSNELQQNILQHELLHLRNNDWLLAVIAKLCCCLYWCNPFVWFAARQSYLEAEKVCDEHVLSQSNGVETYAEQLVQIARSLKKPSTSTTLAPSMARMSSLRRRIENILINRRRRDMKPITQNLLRSVFLAISIFFVVINSQGQSASDLQSNAKESSEKARFIPLRRNGPIYPTSAAKKGIEGYNVVEYDIQANGKVVNAHVIEAEPLEVFDQASINAVQQWLFLPKYVDDKAMESKGVRSRLTYRLDVPGTPNISINQLETIEQQGPQSADELLSIVKYYLKSKRGDEATKALIAYLSRDGIESTQGTLQLIKSVPFEELDQQSMEKYLTLLQAKAEKSRTGDEYALLAQIYRAQQDWPSAQLALVKAFEIGRLSDPYTTKLNLAAVLSQTHNHEAALKVIDRLEAEYGDTAELGRWRTMISIANDQQMLIANQLLSQSAR